MMIKRNQFLAQRRRDGGGVYGGHPSGAQSFNEAKVPYIPPPEEVEEIKESSLTRLREAHSANNSASYKLKDCEFGSYPEITLKTVEKLKGRGIVNLFPIQQHCFYPIYFREDVMARDLTGSGKTLGYCLPFLEYLRKNKFLGQKRI